MARDSVGSAEIIDNSVTSADIQNGTITQADMARDSVGSAEIIDNSVTSADIQNGTITQADMGANSVGSAEIIDNSVTAADIADNAVTAVKIADNSVTSSKIVDNSITAADIATNTITSAKMAPGAAVAVGRPEKTALVHGQVPDDGSLPPPSCVTTLCEYSYTRLGIGQYRVVFIAFIAAPTVVVTPRTLGDPRLAVVVDATSSSFDVRLFTLTGALVDTDFSFTAVGPRAF
jgi:hypothetical protein